MRRGGGTWLAAILLLAHGPAAAECHPGDLRQTAEEVTDRIDRYWYHARHPGTYRALAGLGDPDRRTETGEPYVPPSAEQRTLLSRMLADPRLAEQDHYFLAWNACRTDYALSVAQERVRQLGMDHPYVGQWLRAQQAVFAACRNLSSWEQPDEAERAVMAALRLPPPLATDDQPLARLQRNDRAYQAASLLFYRRAPGARRAFQEIASSASPHAPVARYMLAAIEARDVGGYDAAAGEARALSAMASARAILADPSLRDVHPLAQGLIGYLGWWTGDRRIRAAQVEATLDALEAPLARIRSDESARERYFRAADDVGHLHGEFEDEAWWLTGAVPTEMTASRAMADQAQRRDMAAWLLFPRSPFERDPWTDSRFFRDPAGRLIDYAESKAETEDGRSDAWAAIRASISTRYDTVGWTRVEALTAETRACPDDRHLAAVAPFLYHQVRTAIMYPMRDEDYRPQPPAQQDGFARALDQLGTWPWKDGQFYRGLVADMLQYLTAEGRLEEARAVRDRLQPRGDAYPASAPVLLLLAEDEDRLVAEIRAAPLRGQPLLNLLSIGALERLARRDELPAPVRARFARTAWARLYALERPIPVSLDRLMRALNPSITNGWRSRPGAGPRDRRLLLDVLRSPALNIVISDHQRGGVGGMGYGDDPGLTEIDTFEHSDNNWWCAWQVERHRLSASAQMYQAFFAPRYRNGWEALAVAGTDVALGPLLRSSWLWRSRDEAELAALAQIPCAPQRLAERAIAWRARGWFGGRRDGEDQAEALALAVRATRYGCQRQGGHGAWSRAAWEMLHERFPGSGAAARTRWWFDCSHFTGGCDRPALEAARDWRYWAGQRWFY